MPSPGGGDRLHDGWCPRHVGPEVEHGHEVLHRGIGTRAIGLVHHEHVGDFEQPRLVRLHTVAPARVDDDDGGVGGVGDLELHLADADGLDEDPRRAGGVEHADRLRRCGRETAEVPTGGHRADEHAGIGGVQAHAHAIAEDGAAGP